MSEKRMTSYDLVMEAGRLMVELEEAGGALGDDGFARLDAFIKGSREKLGAIRAVIDRFKAEAELQKKLKDRHAKKQSSLTKAADRLGRIAVSLLQAKEELGEEPVAEGDWGKVSIRTSQSVDVRGHVDDIPVKYLTEQPPKVDKKQALKDLKAGESIPGIHMVTKHSPNWR
tara:strand:- start:22 stop:537 length:516 start_codon:yes stop_codon:yes gene_type:complete